MTPSQDTKATKDYCDGYLNIDSPATVNVGTARGERLKALETLKGFSLIQGPVC